ncbi:MAG: gluconokinase [Chloroflexi bacterium]|nr:gluconokinase [Chloroflexota bacterium]
MTETYVAAAEAEDPLVLTIDVGTSSARALVYDARGRTVRTWEVHRPYQVQTRPGGGVEIDADQVFDLVVGCVDAILATAGAEAKRIAVIAADTFWHSLMGVDERGRALTPVYTWADTRSREAARELQQRLDQRAVHARTGAVLHSSYLPAKLLWLRQTDPHLVDRVNYWMSFAEYLYLRLFGERRVSLSMASGTGLFDQNSCTWDEEVLSTLDLEREKLSPLAEFSESMSGLKGDLAGRWAALSDRPWYLPIGDGAANNIGSGSCSPEWVVAMIGTSGAIRVVQEAERPDIPWGLWTYRVDRRRFVQGGALSDGGNVFAWLTKTLRLDAEEDLERELSQAPPDSHGLTVLPFLAGQRSPDWNIDARAAMVGMRLDTTPLDIARACLESVAYQFGVIYDILKTVVPRPKGIIGSGAGLIHSPAWMQIMTDVLGEPMVASAVPEASSRGAALLALEAMGAISDLSTIPVPLGDEHQPQQKNTSAYRAAMDRQKELYALLEGSRTARAGLGGADEAGTRTDLALDHPSRNAGRSRSPAS